ncbi:uncharacterized protein LOC108905537 [Anoplophora glabripennis]|uniref:uncharacterized protein LOC108905537 n=1 Tax=Anoplophora glabripennis TaxID=217634 RepID=UPI000873BD17|nr:uncharacterized protein LOC108905537 [Anoplophora glabripennis]
MEVQSIFEKACAKRMITLLLEVREQNNKILATITKQALTNITDFLAPDLPVNLPVQSEEDLNELCIYLSCKANVETLAKYLSSVGGSNLSNKINNILKRCISNEVARNYNFRGRREGKRAFQDLPLKEVVIRAAKLGHPDSTEIDIENYIKVWLKHAPQRYKVKEHKLEKLNKIVDVS